MCPDIPHMSRFSFDLYAVGYTMDCIRFKDVYPGKDPFARGSSSDTGMSRSVSRGGTGFAGGMTTSS